MYFRIGRNWCFTRATNDKIWYANLNLLEDVEFRAAYNIDTLSAIKLSNSVSQTDQPQG